jgi:hypothetical protein
VPCVLALLTTAMPLPLPWYLDTSVAGVKSRQPQMTQTMMMSSG